MHRNTISLNLILTLVYFSFNLSFSQSNISYNEGAMLRWGTYGRAVGMGGAYTAVANGVNSIYWNPAGLSFIHPLEFSISYSPLNIENTHFFHIAGGGTISGLGAIGLDITTLSSFKIPKYEINGSDIIQLDDFSINKIAARIAYSIPLPKILKPITFGISGKIFYRSIDIDNNCDFGGFDIGFLYRNIYDVRWLNSLNFGFVIKNIKANVIEQYDRLPVVYTFGASHDFDDLKFSCDLEKIQNINNHIFRFGIECNKYLFPIRMGYSTNNNLSFGTGIKLKDVMIDIAYIGRNDLGANILFSFHYRKQPNENKPNLTKLYQRAYMAQQGNGNYTKMKYLIAIGDSCFASGNYKKALRFFKKGNKLRKKSRGPEIKNETMMNIAECYIINGKTDEAKKILKKNEKRYNLLMNIISVLDSKKTEGKKENFANIEKYKKSIIRDRYLYYLLRCHEKLHNKEKCAYYKYLLKRYFPDSELTRMLNEKK